MKRQCLGSSQAIFEIVLSLGITLTLVGEVTYGQASPPITSSGLNTQISAPVNLPGGAVQHNITGGTRPGGGANLFHSFGEFGVPTNNIANFLNDAALPTSNILSRVTGGNPSNIFGTIQTEGFGNANLFLMNPAGIVFGPNASLNVGGAAHFTTADYLRLSDGVQFTALPSAQDALLSVAPVAAFGFLESNPASILVGESTLSVSEGQTISLVGGDITIDKSVLNAPGGKIALASVASPGEVLADTFASASNVNGESFTTMANITLSEGATLNVSGDADGGDSAGTIIIRGGNLMMTNATISADTGNSDGAATAVDIQLTNDLIIETDSGPAIRVQSLGAGDAGEVRILSKNMNVLGTTTASTEELGLLTVIDTVSWGTGHAGDVSITTGDLQMTGNSFEGTVIFVDTGVGSEGSGGNIEVAATSLNMNGGLLTTGDNFLSENPSGPAGNVMITSNQIDLQGSQILTNSFANKGGNINIHGKNITFGYFGGLSATGFTEGGAININADRLLVKESSSLESNTLSGALESIPSGGISLMANVIELKEGGFLNTVTIGNSDAGPIHLVATESISLSGSEPLTDRPSGIFSSSFGLRGPHGNAGNVFINTPKLEINDGGRIITATASQGVGGDITINAQSMTINGQQFEVPNEGQFGLGHPLASGIYTSTLGNSARCDGTCGNAGKIDITTGSFMLENGAQIDSGTSSTGQGSIITLKASENISISGTLIDGTPGGIFSRSIGTDPGSGKGGDVSLTAGQSFLLKDGATVSTSSIGPGHAGDIAIAAGAFTIAQGAVINSGTTGTGAGGAIRVNASDAISLSGPSSGLFSRTTGTDPGAGAGGAIALTAGQNVTLRDGATVSASSEGPGKAGAINIDVTAGSFSIVQGAVVDSGTTSTGAGGTITLVADQTLTQSDGGKVSASSSGPGQAGDIAITAGSFTLAQGAVVDSGTTSTGQGGSINVTTSGNLSMSGASGGVFSRTTGTGHGAGTGGTISLKADQNFTLSNGATVSASSSGPGNAGNITLGANNTILIDKATVTTEAREALGGNITLTAGNEIHLTDSQVTSRVQVGSGNAGSINLDPDFIVLKNSKVSSTANRGDGGPITLIARSAILMDALSDLDADSLFGGSGRITIQSPIQNLSGTITPLPQNTLPVTALYGSRCVAGPGGNFSTFVDSKSDSLSPRPGTFLASPFLPLSPVPQAGAVGKAGRFSEGSGSGPAAPLQLASYVPPMLYAQADETNSACP